MPAGFSAHHEVAVPGGALFVARAGPPPQDAASVALLVHGITASHLSWPPVARELAGDGACLLAPDLRGRGRSAGLPGPYGIAAHVRDLVAVLAALGVERAVLAGHSMGAYVVARLAVEHPGRASAVVLVDGGLPLALPDGVDPDAALDAVLGPATARLRMTFASAEEYVGFWRAHPAFANAWTADAEAYARGDLTGEPPALRSRVSEPAVRADGSDLVRDEPTRDAAPRVRAPLTLLRAPRGLQDEPDAPLIPEATLAGFAAERPDARIVEVAGVNHYTITLGAGAGAVAAAIRRALSAAG